MGALPSCRARYPARVKQTESLRNSRDHCPMSHLAEAHRHCRCRYWRAAVEAQAEVEEEEEEAAVLAAKAVRRRWPVRCRSTAGETLEAEEAVAAGKAEEVAGRRYRICRCWRLPSWTRYQGRRPR